MPPITNGQQIELPKCSDGIYRDTNGVFVAICGAQTDCTDESLAGTSTTPSCSCEPNSYPIPTAARATMAPYDARFGCVSLVASKVNLLLSCLYHDARD